jgi:hypothetical protein
MTTNKFNNSSTSVCVRDDDDGKDAADDIQIDDVRIFVVPRFNVLFLTNDSFFRFSVFSPQYIILELATEKKTKV